MKKYTTTKTKTNQRLERLEKWNNIGGRCYYTMVTSAYVT